jgi:hypothetical protein
VREIDAKVAECLGYAVITNYRHYGENCFVTDSAYNQFVKDCPHDQPPEVLPHFSTTGDGMLLLIEEARKQGIYLDPSPYPEGWRVDALELDGDGIMSLLVTPLPVIIKSLPLATALSFLKAKGVDITPYVKGVKQ